MEYQKLDKKFKDLKIEVLDFNYDNLFLYYRQGKYLGFGKNGKSLPKTVKKKGDILIDIISFSDRNSAKKKVLEKMYDFDNMLNNGVAIIDISDYNLDIIICLSSIFNIMINSQNAIIEKKEKNEEILKYLRDLKRDNDFNSKSFNLIKKKILK